MAKSVKIKVDGKVLQAKEGEFLLDVCRKNGIFIPTLCTHRLLTPFGACRMCIVEVEGMRTFPTSCTLPVQDGMVVHTDTEAIRQARLNILEFILSEHPSGCLLCPHREECYDIQECNVKLGITTGCRFCAKDGACELQNLVEKEGLKALSVQSVYRNFPVEDTDPFFVRDYNLCILCGRCVRVCQEVRLTGTISFTKRGPFTKVGTAFDVSHIDAGCEFCGTCVDVCPTGALYERTRKFRKSANEVIENVCPFCGYLCKIELEKKDGEVFAVKHITDLICSSGKFGVVGMLWAGKRVMKPMVKKKGILAEAEFEDAVKEAKGLLDGVSSSEKALVLSPTLPLETVLSAFEFAKKMGIKKITSRVIKWKGEYYPPILSHGKVNIGRYETILVFTSLPAPLEIEVKRARKKGKKVYEFTLSETFLTRHTTGSFRVTPAQIDSILRVVMEGKKNRDWRSIKRILGEKLEPIIEDLSRRKALLLFNPHELNPVLVARFAKVFRADILPVMKHAGERILLEYGDRFIPFREVVSDKKIKVIYSIGEPYIPSRARIILQIPFIPPSVENIEVVLPTLSAFEEEGTYFDMWGRKKRIRRAVSPDFDAFSDRSIMEMVAGEKLRYRKIQVKKKRLSSLLNKRVKTEQAKIRTGTAFPVEFPSEFKGFLLNSLKGFQAIYRYGYVMCSPETASKLGLSEGESITLSMDGVKVERKVRIVDGITPGLFRFLPSSSEYISCVKSILSGKLPRVEVKRNV